MAAQPPQRKGLSLSENEFKHDVFVSYVEEDASWVEGYLLEILKSARTNPATENDFIPGEPWLFGYERLVRECKYTLLILSPAYKANRRAVFVDYLAFSQAIDANWQRVIPFMHKSVILPDRFRVYEPLDGTSAENEKDVIDSLLKILQKPPPPPPPIPPCPYPGLRPYMGTEGDLFFGRKTEIRSLLEKLRTGRTIWVVGPSGSGKSSLVLAGLVPYLTRPGEQEKWEVRIMHPGINPVQALEDAFQPEPRGNHILLVVDQLEELFTQSDTDTQTTFITRLENEQKSRNLYVIYTLRSDFFAEWMSSPLWEADTVRRVEVPPLRGPALRDALTLPAAAFGVQLEDTLIERLLADTEAAGAPGLLPLLQETMRRLWQGLDQRYLRLSVYEALGHERQHGFAAAVEDLAEEAYANLGPDEELITRRIFLGLIQFGDQGKNTRRQQPVSTLRSGDDAPEIFARTLETLADERLLTLSGETGERYADIAHEALITHWGRMQTWVERFRELELERRRWEARASEWEGMDHKGGFLDGEEISRLQIWLVQGHKNALTIRPQLADYLEASIAHQRKLRRQRILVPLVVVVLVALLAFGGRVGYLVLLRHEAIKLSPNTVINEGMATIGNIDPALDLARTKPAWTAVIPEFRLDNHEVTFGQYCLCWKAGGCTEKILDKNGKEISSCNENPLLPVSGISQVDARLFCTWIGRRLPTEFEWEWAARGPDNRTYPTGDDPPTPKTANISGTIILSIDDPINGQDLIPSTLIISMAGNVSEWTLSPFIDYNHPSYLSAQGTQGDETPYVYRGGSWVTGSGSARVSARNGDIADSRLPNVGFRCLEGISLDELISQITPNFVENTK